MQQRRVRLGDILDDYCPRERRITNHAVVAMIDDEVKQTRCTTCQSDHEYKAAKTPPPRRRKTGALSGDDAETVIRPRAAAPVPDASEPAEEIILEDAVDTVVDVPAEPESDSAVAPATTEQAEPAPALDDESHVSEERDEWPVHRPLIRATLPRPEGQTPERKAPDFTFRPGGGRFDAPRNGKRTRGQRSARQQGQGQGSGQGRFQGPRQGSGQAPRHSSGQGSPQGPRHGSGRPRQGSGQGAPPGQRQGPGGGRPGQGRGPRQGSGPGRKRGR